MRSSNFSAPHEGGEFCPEGACRTFQAFVPKGQQDSALGFKPRETVWRECDAISGGEEDMNQNKSRRLRHAILLLQYLMLLSSTKSHAPSERGPLGYRFPGVETPG